MKSLLELHTNIAHDMGEWLGVDPSRDIKTMCSRCAKEGDEFLILNLPTFCDGVLYAVREGAFDPSMTPGFRCRGGLPVFLRGYMDRLFSADCSLRVDADHKALTAIRQICLLSKKIERPVKGRRLLEAQKSFVDCDKEVGNWEDTFDNPTLRDTFKTVSKYLFRDIWYELMNEVNSFSLIPRHGPGAVAEKLSAKAKWDFPFWYESIERYFPHHLYTDYDGRCDMRDVVAIPDEQPVRVVFVPKTVKTPRVIAIEPSCRQFCQQSVARFLYKKLRRRYRGLDLTDQTRNQRMARQGSRDQSYATLDLSEASDRVSTTLVEWLTDSHPEAFDVLMALRTSRAELPDGTVIPLRKFASMGSALTFPIEAMAFFAAAVVGIMSARGLTSPKAVKLRDVSVFGDDIIVPGDAYDSVCGVLEALGLKVNTKKSYGSGPYRESCGKEYFAGEDVTISKLKKDLPTSRRNAQSLASLVAMRNEMYLRSYDASVRWLDAQISRVIRFQPAPLYHPSLSAWTTELVMPDRVDLRLQVGQIRRPILKPVAREYRVDGREGVFKWHLESIDSGFHRGSTNPYDPTDRKSVV